ncbi:J domain-containing protein [Allorhizobium pseudoryzae]|uniref:J domain-containing protein n=1 Tax=Allorhizobium pseudoryzae TaxID=379684 RepID=UPI003D01F1A1
MRDPYSILGVRRDAPADEIKAAWRTKAKTLHPDHNQDDPTAAQRFAEMGQAYDVLKDPERRRRYDRAVETQQTIMQQREVQRQAEERAKAARAKAEQVMEELARANAQAGGQAKAKTGTQGQASGASAAETPEEMVERIFGTSAEARAAGAKLHEQQQAQAKADGASQDGADAEPGAEAGASDSTPKPAPPLPLQALELITSLMRRIRGEAPPPEKAPDLLATAKVTLDDMLKLNVATVALSDGRDVRLPLEAGMTDGQEIRMKGQGLRLQGMQRGDLVVTLKMARDERFQVDGYDLHTVLSISLEDAVLGGEHEVETPGGKIPISVPAWSGSDQSVTVPGLGLLKDGGERGDLIVELRVILWEKPDAKVVDLMRHMRHGLFV